MAAAAAAPGAPISRSPSSRTVPGERAVGASKRRVGIAYKLAGSRPTMMIRRNRDRPSAITISPTSRPSQPTVGLLLLLFARPTKAYSFTHCRVGQLERPPASLSGQTRPSRSAVTAGRAHWRPLAAWRCCSPSPDSGRPTDRPAGWLANSNNNNNKWLLLHSRFGRTRRRRARVFSARAKESGAG